MRNKDVLMQVLRVFVGEAICIGLMLAVYAIIHKLSAAVLYGALAGGLIAIGNFLFLSISVARAAEKAAGGSSPAKAKASIQRGSSLRLLAVLVLYIVLLKTGSFDPLAAVLPMIFVQISIYIMEFFRKDGEKPHG